ncbi:MAG: metal ABC transporter ATP-binding protein [Mangrovibacterium sp.]
MNELIEIKNLSVSYDGVEALQQASLHVHAHDFIGIIGPNGGGKTSLIKAVLGLVKPSEGEVHFHIGKHEVGYLPQVNQIDKQFPITVLDVVRSGQAHGLLNRFGKEKQASIARAEQLLHEVDALHLRNKAIGELSGGQMQRVFLCRALMNEPKLLILDEPDTYVDSQFEASLYEKLRELNQQMAIILISHDIGTISSYVKTIACVNKNLHYHPSNSITSEQLAGYNCPLQIVSHGEVPHTVLCRHEDSSPS